MVSFVHMVHLSRTWCQGRWTLLLSSVPQGFLWKPKEAAACRRLVEGKSFQVVSDLHPKQVHRVPSQDFSSSILEYLQPHGGLSGCWEAPPVQPLFRHAPNPCRWRVMITWAAAQWLSFHASLPLLPFCPHFIVGCSTWYCLCILYGFVFHDLCVLAECDGMRQHTPRQCENLCSSSHAELMTRSVKIIIYFQLNTRSQIAQPTAYTDKILLQNNVRTLSSFTRLEFSVDLRLKKKKLPEEEFHDRHSEGVGFEQDNRLVIEQE